MKKCYFACCLFMALSLSGCYLLPEEEKAVEIPQLVESSEELYTTTPVDRGDIESLLICSINVEATETVTESFTEGGKVAKFYYMKGEKVKEGDLLGETESIDYEQQIAQQELTIKEKALDVENAKVLLQGKDESKTKALKREIEDLQEEVVELNQTLSLDQALLAEGAISQNEVDQVQKQIRDHQEEIADKTEELEDPDISDKETKKINLQKAQVAYESAVLDKTDLEEKLARTKLYASCSGTITYFTNKQEGEIIGKEEKIYQIAKEGEKRITYQGNDTDKFNVGDRVTITADDKDYAAEVIETPATVPFEERRKASYMPTVYLRFVDKSASADFSVMPNILRLTKVLDSRKNVLRVPTSSVLFVDGKSYIYVLENDIRVQKPIETGLSTEAFTEVVSGLQEGELIII